MSFVQRKLAHCDQCGHEWIIVAALQRQYDATADHTNKACIEAAMEKRLPTHCAKCKSRQWNAGEKKS